MCGKRSVNLFSSFSACSIISCDVAWRSFLALARVGRRASCLAAAIKILRSCWGVTGQVGALFWIWQLLLRRNMRGDEWADKLPLLSISSSSDTSLRRSVSDLLMERLTLMPKDELALRGCGGDDTLTGLPTSTVSSSDPILRRSRSDLLRERFALTASCACLSPDGGFGELNLRVWGGDAKFKLCAILLSASDLAREFDGGFVPSIIDVETRLTGELSE